MKKNKFTTLLSLSLIISAGCASMKKQSAFDIMERSIQAVEEIIMYGENEYLCSNVQKARIYCDNALQELFVIKKDISENEYERLHSHIGLLRVKVNQSRHSKASTIKSDLFPLVWNSRVEKWINYYTGRGRSDLVRCIERSKRYVKYIEKVLEEYELPHDLIYVPIIESGYYPFAQSRVGAVGLWQFMKTTAKLQGLKIDEWIDERRDPEKATVAAAKLLKELYNEFGTWELALAGYNYGPQGVKRRIRKWDTSDYWELYLPRETENFVPKIMAAIFIMREPEIFGFKEIDIEEIHTRKEFEVTDSVDLRDIAKWTGVDIKKIQILNPELKNMCTPPGKKYYLKVPEDSYEALAVKFNSIGNDEKYLSKKELDRRVRRLIYYRVRRGDNLWGIAKKFKVTPKQIRRWNNLSSNIIYPKQKLKISRRGGSDLLSQYVNSSTYIVKRGDTLGVISKRCGTSVANIKKWNKLSSDIIHTGQKLKVSGSNASPIFYKVKRGDTLGQIAKKFNVSLNKIKQWNKLTRNIIYPNQKLKIYKHGI